VSGNDIIDIALAKKESNWKRKGFLEKLFTPPEQLYIRQAQHPVNLVWLFWSMKESAYKVYTRQYSGRFFAPNKIECALMTSCTGQVTINQRKYNTISALTDKYIYSIAKPSGCNPSLFHSKCFYNHKSSDTNSCQLINEKIKNYYASITGKEKMNLTLIKDNNNLPTLFCKDDHSKIPVSITHHGNYAAFTIN
jgi:phosphopantetheinyl transferase (holo-ACP synthase)